MMKIVGNHVLQLMMTKVNFQSEGLAATLLHHFEKSH